MQKKEYFCPSCRKIVKEVKSEFGSAWVATTGASPDYVCVKCDTNVVELTKSDGKTNKVLV